ncbi:MAG: FkbM family methyltransferase [Desulfosporosinus sp.]|nr:FkbM family methyltransferase [Desulfosporosinus sp.]
MKKYNVIIATDLGTFIINRNDLGVGWQLSEYGIYDRVEMNYIKALMEFLRTLKPNLTVIDAGANIGMHSFVFSSQVGPLGQVYAFEAQRIIFNMLAGNMAINSISNVHCFHNAVSNEITFIDIPQFDYGKPLSFGSVEFDGEQKENIGQERIKDEARQEQVFTVVLDDCKFDQVDFIKIDVEGMEMKVLDGAKQLIMKCKPLMLIEYLKSDSAALQAWLFEAKYEVYVGIGANYLCVPEELDIQIGGKIGNLTKLIQNKDVSRA